MSKLKTITKRLGKTYREAKDSEKDLKKLRKEFFDAITEEVEQEPRARKTWVVLRGEDGHPDEEAAFEIAKLYNPGWIPLEIEGHDKLERQWWEVVLEEDPSQMPYVYVNPEDGNQYVRQVVDGPTLIDDERLQDEDPELYEQVTYEPEPKRVFRDLEKLDPQLIQQLQPYVYEGKKTVKLAPVKPAKDE